MFTDAAPERNVTISRVGPGWNDLMSVLEANYAFLQPDSSLAYALVEHASWSVVQADDDLVILSLLPAGG